MNHIGDINEMVRLYYCQRCQMKYPKGHSHVRVGQTSGITALMLERGHCGCWPLRYECENCKKLLCGKNGACCVRLTKGGFEAPNGRRKLCVDCGIKIRRGDI